MDFFDLTVKDLDRAWRAADQPLEVDRRLIAKGIGKSFLEVRNLSLRETTIAKGALTAAMMPYKHRAASKSDAEGRRTYQVYRCYCPPCECLQCGLAIGCVSCQCAEELLAEVIEPTYAQLEDAYEQHPVRRQLEFNDVSMVANCLTGDCDDFGDWELRRYQTVRSVVMGFANTAPLFTQTNSSD